MRPGLNLFVVLLAALLPGPPVVQSIPATGDAKSSADLRYLLVRRAGSPEKNYYELSRTAQLLEPQLFTDQLISQYQPSPKHYGFDIMTDSTARYGVYQAWNVRVLGISDSVKSFIVEEQSA